jgi:hypothetical protein
VEQVVDVDMDGFYGLCKCNYTSQGGSPSWSPLLYELKNRYISLQLHSGRASDML